jgi:hypothetical protein
MPPGIRAGRLRRNNVNVNVNVNGIGVGVGASMSSSRQPSASRYSTISPRSLAQSFS